MILDKLEYAEKYYCLGERIKQGFEYLQNTDFNQVKDGIHDVNENIFAVITSYDTKEVNRLESHKSHIDIQYVISGLGEYIGYKHISEVGNPTEIDDEKDILFYDDENTDMGVVVKQGMFALFMQQDAHNPNLIFEKSSPHRKVVVKIKID